MRLLFILLLLTTQAIFGDVLYEGQMIDQLDIELVGVQESRATAESGILARIKTRAHTRFSQAQFDSDLKALVRDYDRVEPSVTLTGNLVILKLKIWPKPLIRSIEYSGNCLISSEDLQKELEVPACTVFDRAAFNKAFHKLKTYYVQKGFFEAELSYDVETDDETNEVDITICVEEGRSGKIRDIIIHGVTRQEKDEILDLMVTKKWSVFTALFSEDGTYNDDAIQHDKYQIINYLHNKGFADAKVEIAARELPYKNRICLLIDVCKGVEYQFGDITFEGNCVLTDAQIKTLLLVKKGDTFSPEALRETVKLMTDGYGSKGYIEAIIDEEIRLDMNCPIYHVHMHIEEGEQYKVGLIKVFGNNYTQTRTILNETLLVPGDVFNTLLLQLTEMRLRNIGFFKCVNVYTVKSSEGCGLEGNYRDVHIEVEEGPTGSFGAFSGLSSMEDVFGGFNISEKNFNASGLTVAKLRKYGLSALKGAGENIYFTATIGQKTSSYHLSWTKPYFKDTKWSVGYDLERSYNKAMANDYEIIGSSASVHATRGLNAYLRFGWHYRVRNTDVKVSNMEASPQLDETAKKAGLISASGVSLSYDSTNHPMAPTQGVRSALHAEYAGFGGDCNFVALSYINTFYYKLNKKGVLKYRADVKTITPVWNYSYNDVPLDERLFLGGDYMIRGFRTFAIGPKFLNKDNQPSNDPSGGMTLVLISGEYNHELFKRLDAFVFADAGDLSRRTWHVSGFKVAVGYGCKIKLFEGSPPVVLGMGYPLNASNSNDVKRFFISLGARF